MPGPGLFAQLRQRHHLAAQAAAAVNWWAAAAAAVAGTDPPADGKQHWTATVDGCPGAFGWGHTRTAALADLESVLAGWAELKDGDTDIPSAGGVDLAAVQAQTGHPKLGLPRRRRARRRRRAIGTLEQRHAPPPLHQDGAISQTRPPSP